MFVRKMLVALLCFVSVAAAADPTPARVDAVNGACKDSTCKPRVPTVTGMGLSSESNTTVASENHCRPGTKENPPVACPPGYVGQMNTTTTTTCPNGTFGGKQQTTSAYDMSGCVAW